MSRLTLNWEFTVKLVFSSDLTYHLSTYQCMKRKQKPYKITTTTQYITWFTPRVGATSTELLLFNSLQNNSSDLCTQLQILPSILTAYLVAVPFLTKTLCAHSCRGRPCTQLGLDLKTKIRSIFFASHHPHIIR